MIYRKSSNKILSKYFIKLLFIIGLIIAGIRLENYFYETENDFNYPILENIELVVSEKYDEENVLPDYDHKLEEISYNTKDNRNLFSYRYAILSYNCNIKSRSKTIASKYIFHFNLISILQTNNIWHKSSEEEPSILC